MNFVDYGVPGFCRCNLKCSWWFSDDGDEGDDCTDYESAGEQEEIDTTLGSEDAALFAEVTKVLRGVMVVFVQRTVLSLSKFWGNSSQAERFGKLGQR